MEMSNAIVPQGQARGSQSRHAIDKMLAQSDLRWRSSDRSGRGGIGDHAGVNVFDTGGSWYMYTQENG